MTGSTDAARIEILHDLLARGVPWPIAREAAASVALDRDEDDGTHSV